MGLAAATTASTAEIWVMVIVMSAVTFFLAVAATFGAWLQRRAPREPQSPGVRWAESEAVQPASGAYGPDGEALPGWPAAAGPLSVPPQRGGEAGEPAQAGADSGGPGTAGSRV